MSIILTCHRWKYKQLIDRSMRFASRCLNSYQDAAVSMIKIFSFAWSILRRRSVPLITPNVQFLTQTHNKNEITYPFTIRGSSSKQRFWTTEQGFWVLWRSWNQLVWRCCNLLRERRRACAFRWSLWSFVCDEKYSFFCKSLDWLQVFIMYWFTILNGSLVILEMRETGWQSETSQLNMSDGPQTSPIIETASNTAAF